MRSDLGKLCSVLPFIASAQLISDLASFSIEHRGEYFPEKWKLFIDGHFQSKKLFLEKLDHICLWLKKGRFKNLLPLDHLPQFGDLVDERIFGHMTLGLNYRITVKKVSWEDKSAPRNILIREISSQEMFFAKFSSLERFITGQRNLCLAKVS